MTVLRRGARACALFAITLSSNVAFAEPTVDECLRASEAGQRARSADQYRAARKEWMTCTASSCPPLVRQDCAGWVRDLDSVQPTVVIAVRTDGDQDVPNARVTLEDGQEAPAGRAIPLDPGPHRLSVSAPQLASAQQDIVVNTAERNRLIVVRLTPTVERPAPDAPSLMAPPAISWVLGGVSLASFAGSLAFGLSGRGDLDDAKNAPCAASRSCPESTRDAAKTKLLVADIALGVGAVALAAGVWIWLAAPRAHRPAPTATVRAGVAMDRLLVEGAF